MVMGPWDRTLRRWYVEGGEGIGDAIIGDKEPVWWMAADEDHDVIACG